MCKSNQEIHLCSCSSIKKEIFPKPFGDIENNRSEYEKTHIIWKLFHYIGNKESGMMGQMIMPVDSLNNNLSASFLLEKINSKNIFDFEYKPSEGDNLIIRCEYIYRNIKKTSRPELYDFMSFIFQEGKWKEEVYDVFNDKTKRFRSGLIKFEK